MKKGIDLNSGQDKMPADPPSCIESVDVLAKFLRILRAAFLCGKMYVQQVYQRGYEKSLLAARCCHVANDFTNFAGDRRTNGQTDKQKDIAIA